MVSRKKATSPSERFMPSCLPTATSSEGVGSLTVAMGTSLAECGADSAGILEALYGYASYHRCPEACRAGSRPSRYTRHAMRVVAITPILVEVPLRSTVQGVHGTTAVQRSVLVRVTTDGGGEGWGNVDPTPGYSLVSATDIHDSVARLAPALIGADPFNLHRALALMDRESAEGFEAKAAIEMALLDVKGRALGLPVHSLLGGALAPEVTLNAWIGTVPPEQAAREATGWLRRGFATAKIKISGAGPEGIARVAAVRAAIGDRMALRVDFNESLALAESVAFI